MQIFLDIVFLAIGFLLLAKGADFFVDGASSVARRFKIPQLIIGLTIVAMGTSMPEAAVSIQAGLQGNADISIGNVLGSNILNILIILGLSALVFPLLLQKSTQKIEIPIVIGASALLFVLGLTGVIEWWGGIILLVAFIGYLTYLFFSARKNKAEVPSFGDLREGVGYLCPYLTGGNFFLREELFSTPEPLDFC